MVYRSHKERPSYIPETTDRVGSDRGRIAGCSLWTRRLFHSGAKHAAAIWPWGHGMSEKPCDGAWTPSVDRSKRVQELMLTPQQFASLSGANDGFSPKNSEQWMMFWKEDICEKDEC